MAGDIRVNERIILVPSEGEMAGAEAAVSKTDGKAMHHYGPRVMIAAMPPEADDAVRRSARNVQVESDSLSLSDEMRAELDEVGRFGVDAFALRSSEEYAEAKAARPHAEEEWDSGVAEPPACSDLGATDEEARSLTAQAPTSSRLTGRVAVGIIIVEGPNNLKFTAAERTKVIAEVQNGLGWLASQSPVGGISWHYDIHVVKLTTKPGSSNLSRAEKEALWRDPAMKKLGYGSGIDGVRDYVEDIRKKLKTDWGYCAFFTKYPLGHFAYAGRPRVVMAYSNDGWSPDNIDRVFAHETGHIFGAPDEYASSGCHCGGSYGYYGVANKNCANCAPGGGVTCLMRSNSWAMCEYTPYHLGFPLVKQSYSGVWRGGNDAHYLWVNASWSGFKKKWEELAKKNLRLIDLEISGSGSDQRFNGVWRSGKGGHYLWVNASWSSFKKKWEDLAKKNLRLVDIEVRVVNGSMRYSGVWLPGSDAYYLWANASWSSFKKKWEELAKKHLRLVDIKSVRVGNNTRYSGIWRAGKGAHYLWVNASWSSFKKKWEELGKKKLRLVDLEVTNYGGQRRYSGVWLPGSDGYYLWVNASWQSFHAKWEELAKQKLRLIDFEVTAPGDPAGSVPFPSESNEVEAEDFGGLFDESEVTPEVAELVAYAGEAPNDGGQDGEGGGEFDAVMISPDETAAGEDGFGGGELGDVDNEVVSSLGPADGDGGGSVDGDGDAADDAKDGLGGGDFAVTVAANPGDETGADGYGGGFEE